MFTHVPLCYNCVEKEVEAPFTNASGEGFCSASCEQTANEEFAQAHAASFVYEGTVLYDSREAAEEAAIEAKERYDRLLARSQG